MRKATKAIAVLFIALGALTFINSCGNNTPVPSHCSNGVQDNGETGVDCGGTCPACATNQLCNGNGTNSWWPMAVGNSWHYSFNNDYDSILAQIGTSIFIIRETAYNDTFRIASNGDIYTKVQNLVPNSYNEYLLLPATLTTGQTWYTNEGSGVLDTFKVVDMNATVTAPSCTYTGCLQISRNQKAGTHLSSLTYFYKKGLGWVATGTGSSAVYLTSVKLN